uniref:Ubiquitin-like domain-containing protein n=1 Tax=Anser brachyrhynchus TaxID=132585 RepID=A0A8B9BPM5_9AVES
MAEPQELSLLVRSPARRHPDLRLRAEPAWTVRRLKAELRRIVPGAKWRTSGSPSSFGLVWSDSL